jgi:exodeoxyribonuclease VII small subunit
MATKMTYESAFAELKKIAEEIDNETVSVDVLAEKVKRASELIGFCKTRLRSAEKEISQIIKGMETINKNGDDT